uniref:Uncharacterized protein n=1 Tax=Athene cunicularia TaxID=194338 RepID=A0A663LYI3_ATHCN
MKDCDGERAGDLLRLGRSRVCGWDNLRDDPHTPGVSHCGGCHRLPAPVPRPCGSVPSEDSPPAGASWGGAAAQRAVPDSSSGSRRERRCGCFR